jgi:hypothetical protein
VLAPPPPAWRRMKWSQSICAPTPRQSGSDRRCSLLSKTGERMRDDLQATTTTTLKVAPGPQRADSIRWSVTNCDETLWQRAARPSQPWRHQPASQPSHSAAPVAFCGPATRSRPHHQHEAHQIRSSFVFHQSSSFHAHRPVSDETASCKSTGTPIRSPPSTAALNGRTVTRVQYHLLSDFVCMLASVGATNRLDSGAAIRSRITEPIQPNLRASSRNKWRAVPADVSLVGSMGRLADGHTHSNTSSGREI